jgi:hypothetical protein
MLAKLTPERQTFNGKYLPFGSEITASQTTINRHKGDAGHSDGQE